MTATTERTNISLLQWKRIANFLCFQAGWFACALGAAGGRPYLGPLVVAALLLIQLPLVPGPGRQARFVSLAMLFGWGVDSALARAGVFSFGTYGPVSWLSPMWMAALWANFAGTLHLCLSWLRGRYLLASVLGVCGGPLAYYGGHRLGALQLGPDEALSLAVIAAEWAVMTPALIFLSEVRALDGLQSGACMRTPMLTS